MILTFEQLRVLATLRRRADELVAAQQAYDEQEGLACSMSISLRQIAIMGRTSAPTVHRRQQTRVFKARQAMEVNGR